MLCLKKIFNSIAPVIKYVILSYLLTFISFFVYIGLGGSDANYFVINYATYILTIFNIVYLIYLFKKNRILCKKTKPIFPFVMLGIAISSFANMIIFKCNSHESINFNIYFLIISSVIVGPFVEEIIYRHLLVNKLIKFNNRILTILIASFIFAISHNGLTNIIYTFFLGIILNVIYLKNKNILYPLLVHSSANLIALLLQDFNPHILTLSFISINNLSLQ